MTNIAAVSNVLSFREEVALEIHTLLDNIGTSYLTIGKCLKEARADFESQAEFLEWVKGEFGIMKTQTFNMMKVYAVFGESEEFKGVALRVLVALAPYVDDRAVMERAAEAHKAGNLINSHVAKVIDPIGKQATQAAVLPAKAANDSPVQVPGQPEKAPENTGQAPESLDALDDAPPFAADVVIDGEMVEATPQPIPAAPVEALVTSERERGLLSLVETLRDTIAQMQADMRKQATERETRIKAAPLLPQFKSKCLYARLGLSSEEAQDPKAVKKAQRELVKLGYNSEHAAWSAISEAVESLTAK